MTFEKRFETIRNRLILTATKSTNRSAHASMVKSAKLSTLKLKRAMRLMQSNNDLEPQCDEHIYGSLHIDNDV